MEENENTSPYEEIIVMTESEIRNIMLHTAKGLPTNPAAMGYDWKLIQPKFYEGIELLARRLQTTTEQVRLAMQHLESSVGSGIENISYDSENEKLIFSLTSGQQIQVDFSLEIGAGAVIDDTTPSDSKVYSSEKVENDFLKTNDFGIKLNEFKYNGEIE